MASTFRRVPPWVTSPQISLRGALWLIALAALALGILRIRAGIQRDYAGLLERSGCEVRYEPVAAWPAATRLSADPSDVSFHMSHKLTFVLKTSDEDIDNVVAIAKQIRSVREIELRLLGGCGNAWPSHYQLAESVQRKLPGVSVKLTAYVIRVVG